MNNEDHKKRIKDLEVFLTQAFCIDGECNYIEEVKINSTLKTIASAMFALTDSKRGRFFITLSK